MKRFGTFYGGFTLPTNLEGLDKNSIVYSFGVGEDISFDIIVAKQLGSDIHLFDPTPRAIQHVDLIKRSFDSNIKPPYETKFGGGDKEYINILFNNKIQSSKIFMNGYGLYTENTTLKFYKPRNPNYVSHSLDMHMPNVNRNDYIEVEVKSLKTIMEERGHSKIDLLNVDIEGVEIEVLNQMLDNNIQPKYLCVDFDKRRANRDKDKFDNLINRLKSCGYKILHSDNYDISFKLEY